MNLSYNRWNDNVNPSRQRFTGGSSTLEIVLSLQETMVQEMPNRGGWHFNGEQRCAGSVKVLKSVGGMF